MSDVINLASDLFGGMKKDIFFPSYDVEGERVLGIVMNDLIDEIDILSSSEFSAGADDKDSIIGNDIWIGLIHQFNKFEVLCPALLKKVYT